MIDIAGENQMTASITARADGATVVIAIEEEGEYRLFSMPEINDHETPGQIDDELFHGHVVFNYSLLGEPDADAEEHSKANAYQDEYA